MKTSTPVRIVDWVKGHLLNVNLDGSLNTIVTGQSMPVDSDGLTTFDNKSLDILRDVLEQLTMMNIHLRIMTGEEVSPLDVDQFNGG